MSNVTHRFETVFEDEMSTKRVLKLTIPPGMRPSAQPTQGEDEQLCGLEAALRALARESGNRPRTVREVLRYATEKSGFHIEVGGSITNHAAYCTEEDFLHGVACALHQALEIVGSLPETEHKSLEGALTMAFHAGTKFKEAMLRRDHLQNLKRELSQAKSRKRGNEETRRTSLERNLELFKFMHKRLTNGETRVMHVARLAARRGLGAQTGNVEKDAKANRSRYNRWAFASRNN